MKGNVVFSTFTKHQPSKEFIVNKRDHETENILYSISENRILGQFMNVSKWGSACVELYYFNMMAQRTKYKIYYKDITLIP